MNQKRRSILTSLLVAALCLPTIALAHGGEEHVNGTVVKVSDSGVTVKDAKGKVIEVAFDAKTTFSKAKATIAKTDIKAGDRIVIHAAEVKEGGKEKLIAKTVEIGTALKH